MGFGTQEGDWETGATDKGAAERHGEKEDRPPHLVNAPPVLALAVFEDATPQHTHGLGVVLVVERGLRRVEKSGRGG